MEKEIVICDECGSGFYAGSSKMKSLCPQCASALYGYPACEHIFKDGRCILCNWDGSTSDFLKGLSSHTAEGINTEIDPPAKLDEVLAVLSDYSPVIRTRKDPGYDYLSEDGYCVVICDGSSERLYVDLDYEFTLGLGIWHDHYNPCRTDYERMMQTLNAIVSGTKAAVNIMVGGQWKGGWLESASLLQEKDYIKKAERDMTAAALREGRQHGYQITCTFLDKSRDLTIDVDGQE